MSDVSEEDNKLITLARSARARNNAAEGAAVRDETGLTYIATTVSLSVLSLSAGFAAIAAAVSSGASKLECVVVVTDAGEFAAADVAAGRELAVPGALMHRCDPSGAVVETISL
jgi:cytidine deaminase